MSAELNEVLMYPIKIRAKLDQNECPLKPPKVVLESIKKSLEVINRYQTSMLFNYILELYSDYCNVNKNHLFMTPGIDVIFEKILHYMRGKTILVTKPTYFLFEEQAKQFGVKLEYIVLQEPYFSLELDAIYSRLKKIDMIFLANPNNPTGQYVLDQKEVQELIEEFNGPIIIDEAYYEYGGKTAIQMVENYDNLIVTRTLSKAFCLAGIRASFIALSKNLRNLFFDRIEMFRISTPTLLASKAALENRGYIKHVVAYTERERNKIFEGLKKMGLIPYPSVTNFLLVNTKMEGLQGYLYSKGILVKDLSNMMGSTFIRVSVGLPKENDLFLEETKNYLNLKLSTSEI